MKKIILSIILLFFLYFVPNTVYGQTPVPTIGINIDEDISIPVLTCGVAGDMEGKDKCCYTPFDNQCSSPLLDFVIKNSALLPPLQAILTNGVEKCEKIKKFANDNNDSPCVVGEPTVAGQTTNNFFDPDCKCVSATPLNPNQAIINMCARYLSNNPTEATSCVQCASKDGMWTGMGCLPLDLKTLISSFVLSTGIGIGGMFALLCIIYSAFMMQSSQGNPEKLKKAQEMITSCIMGLMLIIFSVFIMKIIGVNILRIPGFR